MLNDLLVAKCKGCGGSNNLVWHCSQDTNSGVADGRLRMHEIHTVFYLACEYCSETVKTVKGDEVADLLTQSMMGN